MVFALEFPPIGHVTEWPELFGSGIFSVNKVVLLMWISVLIVFLFFFSASRKQQLVPTGFVKNAAEAAVDFVREGIIMQTIGPDGLKFTPYLLTLFSFIFMCNIWGIIPGAQMPVNARIAIPMVLALISWVIYHAVGIAKQGFFGYLKSSCIPPGVPVAILPLVALIELSQILIVRPLSLAVRLFANMLAGHLLLVSFAVISAALWESTYAGAALPLFMLIALSGFELLVVFLQAFIFTILTAVYIGGAMHPEH